MTACIGIKRTDSHKPVNARLALQMTVNIVTCNLDCGGFDSALVFLKVNSLKLVAVTLSPADIHS